MGGDRSVADRGLHLLVAYGYADGGKTRYQQANERRDGSKFTHLQKSQTSGSGLIRSFFIFGSFGHSGTDI